MLGTGGSAENLLNLSNGFGIVTWTRQIRISRARSWSIHFWRPSINIIRSVHTRVILLQSALLCQNRSKRFSQTALESRSRGLDMFWQVCENFYKGMEQISRYELCSSKGRWVWMWVFVAEAMDILFYIYISKQFRSRLGYCSEASAICWRFWVAYALSKTREARGVNNESHMTAQKIKTHKDNAAGKCAKAHNYKCSLRYFTTQDAKQGLPVAKWPPGMKVTFWIDLSQIVIQSVRMKSCHSFARKF